MPTSARVVIPGIPHHITQRGSRGLQVFLQDTDYASYLTLLKKSCEEANTEVLGWCLMPNHVHLILVPQDEDGLRNALAEPHRIYARMINEREGWQGHLWQDRFASFPMDDAHLVAALRYVELNPVRAGLARRPEEWKWSSARGHLAGTPDSLVHDTELLKALGDWKAFLESGIESELKVIRDHIRSSRPLGDHVLYQKIIDLAGIDLRPRKRGRPFKH